MHTVAVPKQGILGEIRRVLKYLKATKDDKRIMESIDLLKIEKWVDAPHTVHEDTRGHTGGCMPCGVVTIHGKASKYKLNTKRTTESEVVAVSEYVPYKIHMINIFGGQGYALQKSF